MGRFTSSELDAAVTRALDGAVDLIAQRDDALRCAQGWEESAAQFHRNEEYYRGLLDEIGNIIGPEAFIADDGSVQQDVLRAKLPELVRRLKG